MPGPAKTTSDATPPDLSRAAADLAEAAASASADDLPTLARLHTSFEQLAAGVRQSPLPREARTPAVARADAAASAVEQVILAEAPDPAAALTEVAAAAEALAKELGDTTEPEAAPPEPRAGVIAEEDRGLVAEFATEARTHLDDAERALTDNAAAVDVALVFRAFHTIKGVAGFLNLAPIQQLAHATETLLDKARAGKLTITGTAADRVLTSVDLMRQLVADAETAAKSGTPLPTRGGVAEQVAACEAVEGNSETQAVPEPAAATTAPVPGVSADASVKVATERLDALIDMVGELVIAQGIVAQHAATLGDPRLARETAAAGKVVRELQDLSMSLRMVNVGGVFDKMRRVARDAARRAGKSVTLEVVGGDTELDRNVVDALADPLVHMVRNAIDHGIEPAGDRGKLGKPAAGRVELRACHKGGAVQIEVRDDGRGLDAAKIRARAVACGVLSGTEAAALADADVYRLIFHGGLSTAETVGELSGRGVGMDVVKQNIERLRGRIDIASAPGAGSVFTIRLPLTLAVIDGLTIECGGERYVLPIANIERSLRPRPEQVCKVHGFGGGSEILNVRGALLPLVRLHERFGLTPRHTRAEDALAVIVNDADRRACLMVDDVVGQEQVVIKSLSNLSEDQLPGVSGAAVLGDGATALILDVAGLLSMPGVGTKDKVG